MNERMKLMEVSVQPQSMPGRRFRGGVISAALFLMFAAPVACPTVAAAFPPVIASFSQGVAPAGSSASATASCPSGTLALGGGFTEDVPPFMYPNNIGGMVTESKKSSAASWRVSVRSVSGLQAANVSFTAFVTCRRTRVPSTTETHITVASTGGGAAAGPTAVASCPGGRKALAGGFALGAPVSAPFTSPVVVESRRASSTAWKVSAAEGAGTSVTSYAECAKPGIVLSSGQKQYATSSGQPRDVRLVGVGSGCGPNGSAHLFMIGFSTNGSLSNSSNGLLYPWDSRPDPGPPAHPANVSGWRTTVIHNDFTGPPLKMSSRGYCY
jgi:hypothetical protein